MIYLLKGISLFIEQLGAHCLMLNLSLGRKDALPELMMSTFSVSIRGGTMLDLLLTFTDSNCEAVSKRWLCRFCEKPLKWERNPAVVLRFELKRRLEPPERTKTYGFFSKLESQ